MRNFRLSLMLTAVAALVVAVGVMPAGAANLVARYTLTGNADDISGNAYNGVNTNDSVSWISDPDRGTVAVFDGSAQINVGASGYAVTEAGVDNAQFAIGFWIKPTAVDADGDSKIDYNDVMGGTNAGVIEIVGDGSWNNFRIPAGGVGVNSGGGGGSGGIVPGIDLYDGDWHYVFIQWFDADGTTAGGTGSKADVWFDGIAADIGTQNYNGNGSNPGDFVLGGPCVASAGGGPDDYYTGLMSDVTFWDAQLTASDVANILAATPEDDFTWNVSGGDGLWATGTNWTGATAPNAAATARAIVGVSGTDAAIDLASTDQAVHSLVFTGDVETTITASGSATLHLGQVGADPSALDVNHGTVTNQADVISAPVSIDGYVRTTIADVGDQLTFSGVVSGAGELSLTSANLGTVILTQANTLTGSASVYGGTLKITDAAGLQNAMVTIGAAGTLDISSVAGGAITFGSLAGEGDLDLGASTALTVGGNNNTTTYSGVLSGSGASLTKLGTGKIALTGASTYTGATTVSAGTLSVDALADGGVASNVGASSNAASNLVLGAGTTLQYVGAGSSTDRQFTVGGDVTIDAAGTGSLNFTNTGSLTYGTADTALTLSLAGDAAVVNSLSASVADNGTGAVGVTKNGKGTWALNGTNTYTGDTLINAGALRVASMPTNSEVKFNNTSSNFNTGWDNGAVIEGSGTLNASVANAAGNVYWQNHGGFSAGGGDLTVNLNSGATVVWGDATGFNGKTLILGSATADSKVTFANALDLGGSTRKLHLVDNPNSTTDYAEISTIISGTGGGKLEVTGGGTLVLSGDNTFDGGLYVHYGATVVLTGTSSYSGVTTLGWSNNADGAGATLEVHGAAALGSTSLINMMHNATLKLLADADTDFGVPVQFSTNFPNNTIHVGRDPAGSGTGGTHSITSLTLSPNNTPHVYFTGDNGYSLNTGPVESSRDGQFVNNIVGGVVTMDSLTGYYAPKPAQRGAQFRLRGASGSLTIVAGDILPTTGELQPTVYLDGSGTVRLMGDVDTSYFILDSGTFQVGSDLTLDSNVAAFEMKGGTLEPYGGDRTVVPNTTLTANNTVSGSYNVGFTGSVTVTNGDRTLTNNLDTGKTLTLSGAVNLSNNDTGRQLYINGTGETIISGVIANGGAGNGRLTKNGTGTLTLSNTNTYTGTTTVNDGTLALTGSAASSSVTVTGNAALTGGGNVGSLTIQNNGRFDWDFDSADNTINVVAGDLTLNDGWILNIDGTGTPNSDTLYALFTFNGNFVGSTDAGSPEELLLNYTLNNLGGWDEVNPRLVLDGGTIYLTGVGSAGLLGDINGDGVVDAADYIILKQNFNSVPSAAGADGDLNSDNFVDAIDLNLLADYLNNAGGAAVTPEPATLALLAFGGLAVIRRRRRS